MNIQMKKLYLFLSAALVITITGVTQAATISLNTGTETFNGLLLEGNNNPNVGVIFFHGRGQNPNGDVVRHLRQSLNTDGYTTLSIDNPVPSSGPSFSSYLSDESAIESRVFSYFNAAVDSLVASNNNIDKIVIAGFSLGSRFATATAAAWEQGLLGVNSNVELAGLLGVGMYSNIGTIDASTSSNINVFDTINNLGLISPIPVLDMYGNLDSSAANFAADRMNAFTGNASSYTQAALGCPDFNNTSTSYYTRNQGVAVAYTENRCHQLRNGFLTEADATNNTNADVVLRGSANAPLESTASAWMASNVPLSTVPVPGAIWLFGSGLLGLIGVARRKKA